MYIKFSPIRSDKELSLYKIQDSLFVNDIEFNFTPLQDGATLPRSAIDCEWFSDDVQRIDGELHISIQLPHGPNPEESVAFPETLYIVQDGNVTLPTDEVDND